MEPEYDNNNLEESDPQSNLSEENRLSHESINQSTNLKEPYKVEIVWRSTIIIVLIHLSALVGGILLLTGHVKLNTFISAYIHGAMSALGITAGAHRLWAHKSFKAKLPLRIILAYMQTIAIQNSIYEWVRDHRVHHKFSETDADPHNSKRGFFFAHVGWLMCRKHEDVKIKGKSVFMSDLEMDPIVMFQKRHFIPLAIFFSLIVPTFIPWYFFHQDLIVCFFITMMRYALSLNFTWLVNSAAHIWGHKPYDKGISPAENVFVAAFVFGEGWHNYHHVFPWDYKAAEFDSFIYNPTTKFIDFFARIGWAYDLKTVNKSIVLSRMKRTGDGTFHLH